MHQLIFSLPRYEAVIDAYLDGLEASGLSDLSRVTSVASFFVSRVDTLIDKLLEKIGTPEALDLRGKVIKLTLFKISYFQNSGRNVMGLLYVLGCCSASSPGIPALPEEILWA